MLIEEELVEWGKRSELLNVQVFNWDTWEVHFVADLF